MKNTKINFIIIIFFLLILLLPVGFFLAAKVNIIGQQIHLQNPDIPPKMDAKSQPNKIAATPSPVEKIPEEERTTPDLILLGARREAANNTRYDAAYAAISYPGGDVPSDRGACTDVVIRAFRHAEIDLQQLIHEDMEKNFHLYPQQWRLKGPDPNIDHRRAPNQICFFERHGLPLTLEVKEHLDEWQWGDVVYWRLSNGLDHCGIISDQTGRDGTPLVIHNISLAKEEDCLQRWEITGHFRYPVSLNES